MSNSQSPSANASLSPNNALSQEKAARLSEQQKKDNHILSEQKRRQAIRGGFDRLASMIPGMEGQGRSEANVLEHAVNEIRKENRLKRKLNRVALQKGMTQAEFDAAYKFSEGDGAEDVCGSQGASVKGEAS